MKASPKDVRRDLIEFAVVVLDEEHNDGGARHDGMARDLVRLCELNNALHSLAEAECNFGLTPRQEKRECKLHAEAEEIVKAFGPGFVLVTSTDPRGVPLRVILPSGRSNSWGGEGWCVPLTR